MSVFVRQGYLPDGTLLQLADLCHRDIHNGTITLLPIRDLPELIELLTNTLESIETKDPSQNN